MLVRVAQDGWESMEGTLGPAYVAATQLQASQRVKPKVDLIEELLGLTQITTLPPAGSKTVNSTAGLFKPKPRSSQILSTSSLSQTSSSPSSSPALSQGRSLNPFSISSQASNGFGIKPLLGSDLIIGNEIEGFSSAGKKRRWGGGTEVEAKRSGMQMFSGTRM